MSKVYLLEWFTGQHNSAVFTTREKARDAFAELARRTGCTQTPKWVRLGQSTNTMLVEPVRWNFREHGGEWCDAATICEMDVDAEL